MEKPKVVGFTAKAFFEKLSRKRRAKARGESFGKSSPPTLAHIQTNIEVITDEELVRVITDELLRRGSITLNHLRKSIDKTMKENQAIKEKKRKESLERQKEYGTPLRRYLRLAMLNSDHEEERLEELMKWELSDLKNVMREISQARTMRSIPIRIFELSKSNLMSVISYKTMLESKSPEGN